MNRKVSFGHERSDQWLSIFPGVIQSEALLLLPVVSAENAAVQAKDPHDERLRLPDALRAGKPLYIY